MGEDAWLRVTALLMAAVPAFPALRAAKGRVLLYAVAWLAALLALVGGYALFNAA